MSMRRLKITAAILALCVFASAFLLSVNSSMKNREVARIISPNGTAEPCAYDCILVLGAGVNGDKPSNMLEDRLLVASELYFRGMAPKLIMSGDHGSESYDEVNVMKAYAVSLDIPSEDIFMDHAGFSTYESIYRAKIIFGVERLIVVTQEYHLYRALYIAEELGLDAVGVSADIREYRGEPYRETRELLARTKDAFMCSFKPRPTYLGDKISLSGNGNVTNDK